jgi:hypothetical protein
MHKLGLKNDEQRTTKRISSSNKLAAAIHAVGCCLFIQDCWGFACAY